MAAMVMILTMVAKVGEVMMPINNKFKEIKEK
jgi:hypothetical protein